MSYNKLGVFLGYSNHDDNLRVKCLLLLTSYLSIHGPCFTVLVIPHPGPDLGPRFVLLSLSSKIVYVWHFNPYLIEHRHDQWVLISTDRFYWKFSLRVRVELVSVPLRSAFYLFDLIFLVKFLISLLLLPLCPQRVVKVTLSSVVLKGETWDTTRTLFRNVYYKKITYQVT